VARVNILRQVRTDKGWRNAALPRKQDGRIKWPSHGRYLIEWLDNGRRIREAAGVTPAQALEAQKRKRFELEARASGLEVLDPDIESEADALPLTGVMNKFLQDIRTFRKPLTYRKYEHVLQFFAEHAAPKSDARDVTAEDIKKFLAWRESKGFDLGITLSTNRVILPNFFGKLGIENPVKHVPRLPKFRKRPVAYDETELQKSFAVCDAWQRAFFSSRQGCGAANSRRSTGRTWIWRIGASASGQNPSTGFCRKIGKNAPSRSPES
jgi:hypothetical protein